ncbi:hypothetical protein J4408_01580, partial [Candidatus Pacearchaeota archaeon]|nr:hypothetical protein [Candidatus Pacearchaeota archaeon]
MKKRGLFLNSAFTFLILFIALFLIETASATISCDSGDQATTCTISAPKEYGNGDIFDAKNLIIASGGSIYNSSLNVSKNHGAWLLINLTGNLTISSGANITGGNITIKSLNNITILPGGKIITSELGFNASALAFSAHGLGSGKGIGSSENIGAGGAGHGGAGGTAVRKQFTGGLSYGNHTHPVDFGSSGGNGNLGRGGKGGGIIKLNATLILNEGQILANGQAGGTATNNGGGGGSGGSILLIADTISGAGNITSSGGTGGSNGASLGGGGSGGRIAIHTTTYSLTGQLSAFGGSSTGDAEIGAPGTIYKNVNSQTYGDLIISNNNVIPGERSKSNTREIGA